MKPLADVWKQKKSSISVTKKTSNEGLRQQSSNCTPTTHVSLHNGSISASGFSDSLDSFMMAVENFENEYYGNDNRETPGQVTKRSTPTKMKNAKKRRLHNNLVSDQIISVEESQEIVHSNKLEYQPDSSNEIRLKNINCTKLCNVNNANVCNVNNVDSNRKHDLKNYSDQSSEISSNMETQNNRDVVLSSIQTNNNFFVSQNGTSVEFDQQSLSSWGLPACVLQKYHQLKITEMFPWQVECLKLGNVLNGGNLVYSAPTSAGKTLVAEILVLKRVLESRKKAIIILPFVSVAQEKMFYLQKLFQDTGVRVDGYIGAHHPRRGWRAVDVAVCTIEKANSLINRLLEEKKLHGLGVVVVDELHMLGDPNRGYLLELLLTKVRYMDWKMSQEEDLSENYSAIQIIGMSATLPNLDLLARWLRADLYHTDFRPVPLSEHVKFGNKILTTNFDFVRELESCHALGETDGDNVIQLCLETVSENHSVLMFCPSKKWCESLSITIAKAFFELGKDVASEIAERYTPTTTNLREKLRAALDSDSIQDVLEQLRRSPSGLDPILAKCISFGVAFHHAGLTFDERDIVEGAFRNNVLRVLVSTSTLSSGVNLPARRVIVRSPLFNGKIMDVLTYRQMVGRAGRKGIDTEGESILICKPTEKDIAMTLVKSGLKPIQSCLIRNTQSVLSPSMKRAVLEIIVSGVASNPEEVEKYCEYTLLAAASAEECKEEKDNGSGERTCANVIKLCAQFLIENEFILLHIMIAADGTEKKKYVPTPLGNAILASSLSPDDGLIIFKELDSARRCFVLENELHIIYQVTPLHVAHQWTDMNWLQYLTIWKELSVDQQKVGELVGIEERFIVRLTRLQGAIPESRGEYRKLAVHQRFYTALALQDLVNEIPINTVAMKYGCNRGMLQSLQQTASTFAGMITSFCNRLGWVNLEMLLSQFQSRLNFGIQRELMDLVRLSLLNGQRARVLYDSGYPTLTELAHADPKDIETILKNAGPFQSKKQRDDETSYEVEERRKIRCIWLTGKQGMTESEAANHLVMEARQLVEKDLGVIIQWDDGNNNSGGKSREGSSNSSENESLEQRILASQQNSLSLVNITQVLKPDLLLTSDVKQKNEQTLIDATTDKLKKEVTETSNHEAVDENRDFVNPVLNNSEELIPFVPEKNGTGINTSENCNISPKSSASAMNLSDSFVIDSRLMKLLDGNVSEIDLLNENTPSNRKILSCIDKTAVQSRKVECGSSEFSPTVLNRATSTPFNPPASNAKQSPIFDDSFLQAYMENYKSPINLQLEDKITKIENRFIEPQNDYQSVIMSEPGENDYRDSDVTEKVLSETRIVNLNRNEDEILNNKDALHKQTLAIEVSDNDSDDEIVLPMSPQAKGHKLAKLLNFSRGNLASDLKKPSQNSHLANGIILADDSVCEAESPVRIKKHTSSDNCLENIAASKTSLRRVSSAPNDILNCLMNNNLATPPLKSMGGFSAATIELLNAVTDFDSPKQSKSKAARKTKNGEIANVKAIQQSNEKIIQECKSKVEPESNLKRLNSEHHSESKMVLDSKKKTNSGSESFLKVRTNLEKLNENWSERFNGFATGLTVDKKRNVCLTSLRSPQTHRRVQFRSKGLINERRRQNRLKPRRKIDHVDVSSLITNSDSENEIEDFSDSECEISKIRTADIEPDKKENSDFEEDTKTETIKMRIVKKADANVREEEEFKIIDVTSTTQLFNGFIQDWLKQERFSVSIACEHTPDEGTVQVIGAKINQGISGKSSKTLPSILHVEEEKLCIVGLAISWKNSEAYYVSLSEKVQASTSSDSKLSVASCLQAIKDVFESFSMKSASMIAYDMKEQLRVLCCGANIFPSCKGEDPKVGTWLFDPTEDEESLEKLVLEYCPQLKQLLETVDSRYGKRSFGIDTRMTSSARQRAAVEAVLSLHVMNQLRKKLMEQQLLSTFLEVEMPSVLVLTKMELNGFGFSQEECQEQLSLLQSKLTALEQKAYQLAGRRFMISSSKELHKILYGDLRLRPDNDTKSLGRRQSYLTTLRSSKKYKLDKSTLLKLSTSHPLPSVILEYRKLTSAINQSVIPFMKMKKHVPAFGMHRICGNCYHFTATGRVVMQEPNLQTVPRDIELSEGKEQLGKRPTIVSIRKTFVPFKGGILVAADYSQLELRILAHLSRDPGLLNILNSGGDVFKNIAAKWKGKAVTEVTAVDRQQAKQICYGMVYGIGAKSLGEELNVEEEEAAVFMDNFKQTYKGMTKYIHRVVEQCRQRGFVETLMGRRRYLPNISSDLTSVRNHAERQAVNTTIQGSAADLAKVAMVKIDRALTAAFRHTQKPYRMQKRAGVISSGGSFVLQLHDELLYEVNEKDLIKVSRIIQTEMENAFKLSVRLPVKIQKGPSWGELEEFVLP